MPERDGSVSEPFPIEVLTIIPQINLDKVLVPLRDGKNNLYTHLFRAVYATIAAHWFCPPTVSDLEFRAYIQGHFKILHETNPEKRTSMAAQRHYWDYKISGERRSQSRIDLTQSPQWFEPGGSVAPAPTVNTENGHRGL